MGKTKTKTKYHTVKFDREVDDTFIILCKQETGEFTIQHNNILDCNCMFCKSFQKTIDVVWCGKK